MTTLKFWCFWNRSGNISWNLVISDQSEDTHTNKNKACCPSNEQAVESQVRKWQGKAITNIAQCTPRLERTHMQNCRCGRLTIVHTRQESIKAIAPSAPCAHCACCTFQFRKYQQQLHILAMLESAQSKQSWAFEVLVIKLHIFDKYEKYDK